jgi:hypothetical protein
MDTTLAKPQEKSLYQKAVAEEKRRMAKQFNQPLQPLKVSLEERITARKN